VLKEFYFDTGTGEGWGITYNSISKEFIVSDGSDNIYFWDRDTLQEKRRIKVTFDATKTSHGSIWYLNELEFVPHSSCNPFLNNDDNNNETVDIILANVWFQDVLLAINTQTGKILRIFDFSKLYQNRDPSADVFNGISISEEEGVYYVTGKMWPYMYKVRLVR